MRNRSRRTRGFGGFSVADIRSAFRQLQDGYGPPGQSHLHSHSNTHRIYDWHERFIDLLNLYPESFDSYISRYQNHDFKINGVYADGTVTATCRYNSEHLDVLVSIGTLPNRVFCTCEDGRAGERCLHSFALIDLITDHLEDRRTTLFEKVAKGSFAPGKPDAKTYTASMRDTIRAALKRLPGKTSFETTTSAELPPRIQQPETRLTWNIEVSQHHTSVNPFLQQRKKRGDGWTKGRKMAIDTFRTHEGVTGIDAEIQRLCEISSAGYQRVTWSLGTMQVLKRLTGHPLVFLNGEPCTVRKFDATLSLVQLDGRCTMTLRGSAPNSTILSTTDCIVRIGQQDRLVDVYCGQPEQVACIMGLIKLKPVPLEFAEELHQKLVELSDFISIDLPEELAGPVEQDSCSPVVILRSCADGSLDYGFRVRSSTGELYVAGAGQVCRLNEHNGKTVRLRRSLSGEIRTVSELAEDLQLPPSEINGTIHNFEQAVALIERLQSFERSDVEILWDKASSEPIRLLGTLSGKNVSVGVSQKRDWFQLTGSCEIGDHSLDLADVLGAVGDANQQRVGDYVRIGDKGWAKISNRLHRQLSQLRDGIHQDRRTLRFDATAAPSIRELMQQDIQLQATRAWTKCLNRLESAEKLEPKLPTALNAELREYQLEGFKWMRRLAEWGVGGILADDMGLGKTLQTLAVILDRTDAGPCLVIAPTSVGFNWVRETEKFASDLDVHLYRDTDRKDFLDSLGPGKLVVCSYGLALRDAEHLATVQWGTLVLDEAQAIKNSRSKTSMAIASIPAEWKIALTGTPVENHLGELWSIFHVVAPGLFGGWEQFRRRFAGPIEKDDDEARRTALRERLKPFVLRRTKTEVLKELPPRTEANIYVELSDAERAMYNQVRLSVLKEMDNLADLDDVKDQRFRVLALLTRLRQLACSPKLVDETWSVRSSKLIQLCETVTELKEEGHRVLIFSQFVKHLKLIREMLTEEGISYEYLDGTTPASERQKCVDRFQEGQATAFLISLKAGGTGLNLTAADYVIHMDPWWNPAVEDQATDRAHRFGQDKSVMVYRMVAQQTIEDEILRLHDTKRDLVAGIMAGTQAAAKLSTDDLVRLVKESSH